MLNQGQAEGMATISLTVSSVDGSSKAFDCQARDRPPYRTRRSNRPCRTEVYARRGGPTDRRGTEPPASRQPARHRQNLAGNLLQRPIAVVDQVVLNGPDVHAGRQPARRTQVPFRG